jgi:hypothetical protein
MAGQRDPLLFFAVAALAVIILLLVSVPAERRIGTFSEALPGEGMEIECRLVSSKATENGFLVKLEDTGGGRMDGFLKDPPPPNGSPVRVSGTMSTEGGLVFIDRMVVLGQSY